MRAFRVVAMAAASAARSAPPLGLAVAPDGDVLTVNGGNGRIVEISPDSVQVATRFLGRSGSPGGSGALLGLAVASHGAGVYYLDDATTILRLLS